MVEVTAHIDPASVARLENLFSQIEREMPRRMATQIKRAAIYICQSAKRDTKVAPKRITMKNTAEYIAVPSPADSSWPKYQFYYGKKDKEKGRSGKRARPLHLWKLTRKVGTPKQYSHDHYVYTKAHRGKGGHVVGGSKTQEIRELLKIHGGITRYGLAKKSWGWLAHDIASAANMGDLSWKRTKGERRNPRDYVKGLFSQLKDGASAELKNRLDYILDACPESAISAAIVRATNRLEHILFPPEELERMAK